MKKTKTVIIAKIFILLALMLFLSAIITQKTIANMYINGALYLSAIISFLIGAILVFVAVAKDKKHLKNVELARNDERLKEITMRSKAKAFDELMFILSLCGAYWCIDFMENISAGIILGVLALSSVALQLYYFCKYSKEM